MYRKLFYKHNHKLLLKDFIQLTFRKIDLKANNYCKILCSNRFQNKLSNNKNSF